MQSKQIYMKRTDKAGAATFTEHRVWDEALFFSTRAKEVANDGGRVEKITREDFEKATRK